MKTKNRLQQLVANLRKEYKELGIAPLTDEEIEAAKKRKYPLTCDIHLKGLIKRIISEYGMNKGITILRRKYGVVRDTYASMTCIDKASPFYLLSINTYTII